MRALLSITLCAFCLLISATLLDVYGSDVGYLRYATGYFFAMLAGVIAKEV